MKNAETKTVSENFSVIRGRFENNDLIPADYTSSSAFNYFASALCLLEDWAKKKGISNFEGFEIYADSLDTVMRDKFAALIKLLYAYDLKGVSRS